MTENSSYLFPGLVGQEYVVTLRRVSGDCCICVVNQFMAHNSIFIITFSVIGQEQVVTLKGKRGRGEAVLYV